MSSPHRLIRKFALIGLSLYTISFVHAKSLVETRPDSPSDLLRKEIKSRLLKEHLKARPIVKLGEVRRLWFPHVALGPHAKGFVSWRADNGHFDSLYRWLKITGRKVFVSYRSETKIEMLFRPSRPEPKNYLLEGTTHPRRRKQARISCRYAEDQDSLLCLHQYRGQKLILCYSHSRKRPRGCQKLALGKLP